MRVRRERTGVSTAVAAVAIAVAFVVAAVAGYYLEGTASTASTSTSTSSTFSSTYSSTSTSTLSSSLTSTTTSTSTANQTAVMASLAAAAEAECASQSTCLTIYTTQDAGNWALYYGPLFDKQFPWAAGKVNYVSLSSADLTSEVLSQYQAGDVQADLVTDTLAPLIPIYQGGALMNYTTPEAQVMNYSADAVGPAWVVDNLAVVHMIYNPLLLPANEVPTNWSDLANPIFKGKIAFQNPSDLDITAGEFYYLYTTMGNSSWTKLMDGIAANHPDISSTAGAADAEVLNGQAVIGIDTLDDYVDSLVGSPTAPLKIVDIEPLVYTPGVVAITNGAPHPAMAKLVEAWIISPQGQLGDYETNHLPYQLSIGAPLLKYLPPDYRLVDAYSTYSNTTLFQNPGAWSDTFESIFEG